MIKDSLKKKIHKTLRWFLVTIAGFLVLLCLMSWLMSIYIDGIESALSVNGIRWIVGNMVQNFYSVPLAQIIIGLFGVSIIRESGIAKVFRRHISLKQKRALQITLIFTAIFSLLFSLLLLLPNAILLSAFGDLYNSPLQKGLFGIIVLYMLLIGNIYGYTSGRFANMNDLVLAHVSIFNIMSPYFIILFMASQFVCCLDFSNILSLIGNEEALLSIITSIVYYVPLVLYIFLLL